MAKTYVVVGLNFGDEGKGSWVDHLVRKHDISYVLRFNGGAQALHHVHLEDGTIHGFAQFGSGTFVPNTKTILSQYMLLEPLSMMKEAKVLGEKGIDDPFSRVIISENTPIITAFHMHLNRYKEIIRGGRKHGSCGFGIGETQKDIDEQSEHILYMKDLCGDEIELRNKLVNIRNIKIRETQNFPITEDYNLFDELMDLDIAQYASLLKDFAHEIAVLRDSQIKDIVMQNDCVFEGAQGVLLDRQYGFFPYCTRSNTGFTNAEEILKDTDNEVIKIGLMRAYTTRHGAGPFVTQSYDLKVSNCDNTTGPWQGDFLSGWFDSIAGKYALEVVGGVDILAITNLDRLFGLGELKVATHYQRETVFFPQGNIKLQALDFDESTQRSTLMNDLEAEYINLDGFNNLQDPACTQYVEMISSLLSRRVDAVSISATHEQVYL